MAWARMAAGGRVPRQSPPVRGGRAKLGGCLQPPSVRCPRPYGRGWRRSASRLSHPPVAAAACGRHWRVGGGGDRRRPPRPPGPGAGRACSPGEERHGPNGPWPAWPTRAMLGACKARDPPGPPVRRALERSCPLERVPGARTALCADRSGKTRPQLGRRSSGRNRNRSVIRRVPGPGRHGPDTGMTVLRGRARGG